MRLLVIISLALLCAGCNIKEPLSVSQITVANPIIIAHRGLSGEYPEHTLAGYRAAIKAGADYVEPDLVLTKDSVLVARHENAISETTDVADHPEFAARKATKTIDGKKATDWFTEDFTLAELKTLRAKERLPLLRSKARDGQYEIPTFAEILDLLVAVNKGRNKPVGVYPETKHPSYFAQIGLPHEEPLLKTLAQYGYNTADSAVFIQSFEVDNLIALRAKTKVPLIQLMDAEGSPADHPERTYAQMATADGLRAVAQYANGIGPNKAMIIPRNLIGNLGEPTALVTNAHAAGLKVHPWTFRRENFFLPLAMRSRINPASHGDLAAEMKAFLATGIDGLFTDNTPEAAEALISQGTK
jgi:glycerophosphoryl diester phosphodiesterase